MGMPCFRSAPAAASKASYRSGRMRPTARLCPPDTLTGELQAGNIAAFLMRRRLRRLRRCREPSCGLGRHPHGAQCSSVWPPNRGHIHAVLERRCGTFTLEADCRFGTIRLTVGAQDKRREPAALRVIACQSQRFFVAAGRHFLAHLCRGCCAIREQHDRQLTDRVSIFLTISPSSK
jgi:hypothetical protein